jgi:excisionase family DNA binding protein
LFGDGRPAPHGPQVADELQVTVQTIRNWIDSGVLPAVRIGRAFQIRREDVDAPLDRADADSSSLATRRDLWAPATSSLPRRHGTALRDRPVEPAPLDAPLDRADADSRLPRARARRSA